MELASFGLRPSKSAMNTLRASASLHTPITAHAQTRWEGRAAPSDRVSSRAASSFGVTEE